MQEGKGPTRIVEVTPAWVFDESAGPVVAVFIYRVEDPYAVSILFAGPNGSTTWTFARSLLRQGCHEPTGDGEVRVSPDGDHLAVHLRSCATSCHVLFPLSSVCAFLDDSHGAVAQDEERMELDWDQLFQGLTVGNNTSD